MSLQIGDVCVIVKTLLNHEFLGTECTVVAVGFLMHEVISSGENHTRFAFRFQLRRKPPKADYDGNQAGSWDLIPYWQPNKTREQA